MYHISSNWSGSVIVFCFAGDDRLRKGYTWAPGGGEGGLVADVILDENDEKRSGKRAGGK
jgi:hypothetical protein